MLSLTFSFFFRSFFFAGKTVVIDNVQESDTIKELKERVEKREGIPVDQQRLVFNGRQLENSKTVKECNLSVRKRKTAYRSRERKIGGGAETLPFFQEARTMPVERLDSLGNPHRNTFRERDVSQTGGDSLC